MLSDVLSFNSTHVETVVLLSQQKADDHIEIDLDLDELNATSAETKATYAEIKDYVLREHGLKVSNLYISQVKRANKERLLSKYGIEIGENYSLAKSEGARGPVDLCSAWTEAVAKTEKQPNCPEDKGTECPGDIRLVPTEAERRQVLKDSLVYF